MPSFESVHGSPWRIPVVAEKGDTGKGGLRLLPRTVTETKEAKAAETPDTALQHEMQSAGCITSAADALNKRDQSSQPDGGKPRGESRHCQQAECSSPAGTEVQVCSCAYECRTCCTIQLFFFLLLHSHHFDMPLLNTWVIANHDQQCNWLDQ